MPVQSRLPSVYFAFLKAQPSVSVRLLGNAMGKTILS